MLQPKKLYYNYLTFDLVSSTGDTTTQMPTVSYTETAEWEVNIRPIGGETYFDASDADTWRAAADIDFKHEPSPTPTDPMIRTINADIDSTQANHGILKVKLDAYNSAFAAGISSDQVKKAWFELAGYKAGEVIYYIQFEIRVGNCIDPDGGTPPDPPGNYYTKSETLSEIAGAVIAGDDALRAELMPLINAKEDAHPTGSASGTGTATATITRAVTQFAIIRVAATELGVGTRVSEFCVTINPAVAVEQGLGYGVAGIGLSAAYTGDIEVTATSSLPGGDLELNIIIERAV